MRHAAAATGTSVKAAKDAAGTAVRAGVARAAGDVAAATAVAAEKGGALFHSGASGVAAGFGVASNTMAGFAENLDWTTIDPTKYLYAGTRGISRGFEEAQRVWESIPAQLRALGPEEVAKKLDGFDWSHIVPHSEGGSDGAANGIFELASLNRSRGAEQMTAAEVQAAAEVLSQTAFRAAVQQVASKALAGAVAGAAVACVLACLEEGLAYQRGEITRNEMYARIGRAVAKASALGATVSGLMAAVALAFPALIPLVAPLMLPLAVLGASTLFLTACANASMMTVCGVSARSMSRVLLLGIRWPTLAPDSNEQGMAACPLGVVERGLSGSNLHRTGQTWWETLHPRNENHRVRCTGLPRLGHVGAGNPGRLS